MSTTRRRWWCISIISAGLTACSAPAPYAGDVPKVRSEVARSFGRSAEVVTQDVGFGVPVGWEVSVAKPVLLDATVNFPQTSCFLITMEPTFIGEFPVDVTVAMPQFTPVDGELNANYLADPSVCGELEHPAHGYTGELEVGQQYTQWVASWDGLYGIPATGVKLETPEQTVLWR